MLELMSACEGAGDINMNRLCIAETTYDDLYCSGSGDDQCLEDWDINDVMEDNYPLYHDC